MKVTNTKPRALKLPPVQGARTPKNRRLIPGVNEVDEGYFKACVAQSRSVQAWLRLGWLREGDGPDYGRQAAEAKAKADAEAKAEAKGKSEPSAKKEPAKKG